MTRESYSAIDEPLEPLTSERVISMLRLAYEKAELLRINNAINDLRKMLRGSTKTFPDGFADILPSGTGLTASIGRDTGPDSGETYKFSVGWDEAGIVGDIAVEWQEFEGGQIIDEGHFGSGLSAPEITGTPNTLSIGMSRRELNCVRGGLRAEIKRASRVIFD